MPPMRSHRRAKLAVFANDNAKREKESKSNKGGNTGVKYGKRER